MSTHDTPKLGMTVALVAILAVTAVVAAGSATPAFALGFTAALEPGSGIDARSTPVPDRTDDAIKRAFRDVRDDLRGRGDYRSYSGRTTPDVDRVIRRAYQDILNREPDPESLRTYHRRMLNDGWDEKSIRRALRNSDEYRNARKWAPASGERRW